MRRRTGRSELAVEVPPATAAAVRAAAASQGWTVSQWLREQIEVGLVAHAVGVRGAALILGRLHPEDRALLAAALVYARAMLRALAAAEARHAAPQAPAERVRELAEALMDAWLADAEAEVADAADPETGERIAEEEPADEA